MPAHCQAPLQWLLDLPRVQRVKGHAWNGRNFRSVTLKHCQMIDLCPSHIIFQFLELNLCPHLLFPSSSFPHWPLISYLLNPNSAFGRLPYLTLPHTMCGPGLISLRTLCLLFSHTKGRLPSSALVQAVCGQTCSPPQGVWSGSVQVAQLRQRTLETLHTKLVTYNTATLRRFLRIVFFGASTQSAQGWSTHGPLCSLPANQFTKKKKKR